MILHIDMDAYFASVEQRRDPRLRGKPVLVCGEPGTRSVVATASYEARPFGVGAGMSVAEAIRRCPQAILVPGNPTQYVSLSLRLLDLYKHYSPVVEPVSIDEAFVDLGGSDDDDVTAKETATMIQREVDSTFHLSCSIGIGPNKLVAKMASSIRKPMGITALTKEGFQEHFRGQAVDRLWGIGERMSHALAGLGITTLGELAGADRGLLSRAFGINGPRLRQAARGEDDSKLIPYFQGVDCKSMGHEHTLAHDISDRASLHRLLLRLSDQVTRRMRREGYVGRVVALKIRLSDFSTRIRQRALADYIDDARTVYRTTRNLFAENWRGQAVRLVGVSVAELLHDHDIKKIYMFAEDRLGREVIGAVDRVRDEFGENSLLPAATLLSSRE